MAIDSNSNDDTERQRRKGAWLVMVAATIAIGCLPACAGVGESEGSIGLTRTGAEPGWWTRISIEQATADTRSSPPRMRATVPSDVLFALGSADLEAAARGELSDLAETLRRTSGSITVEGHTDLLGSEEANLRLGESRARAVASLLMALGVSPDRLTTASLGESQPVCAQVNSDGTDNADCRARCRRVVITYGVTMAS
ncbi:MAG: OmpA family protein [Actinomycetota bacterium]|nr:OmpA family protein [Actinomycetota bacterium]